MIKKHVWNLVLRILRKGHFNKEYPKISSYHPEIYLKDILWHAFHNCPYYNNMFRGINLVQNNKIDLSKFLEIPILTKDIIRGHIKELVSRDYQTRKWYYNSSGGSTGEPIRFIQDDVYYKWGDVTTRYYYQNMLNIDRVWVKKVLLWGSERDLFEGSRGWRARFFSRLYNTVFLNSYRMTEEDMGKYIATINSYKPDLIRGYAGSLFDLCQYIQRNVLTIHRPEILISAAETLGDEMRQLIEAVFKTKLYNFYGSREARALAGECQYGLMHIFMFNNYVEVLDNDNRPVKEGEEGRVIVTNLHNYSMPLIRYDIGDMAILGPQTCQCGNPLSTLRQVTGRITNHFLKTDGTLISGSALTLTFNLKEWVEAFQIIQEDYKRVKILVVPHNTTERTGKDEIEGRIRFLLGQDCEIIWEFVSEIPKTQSGKYLYIKSLLADQ